MIPNFTNFLFFFISFNDYLSPSFSVKDSFLPIKQDNEFHPSYQHVYAHTISSLYIYFLFFLKRTFTEKIRKLVKLKRNNLLSLVSNYPTVKKTAKRLSFILFPLCKILTCLLDDNRRESQQSNQIR